MGEQARLKALTDLLRPWSALWSRSILQSEPPLTVADAQGLTAKKVHEIERVLSLLRPRIKTIRQAVDIGGGMGHLARLCVRTFDWTFHSIDRDAALQNPALGFVRAGDAPRTLYAGSFAAYARDRLERLRLDVGMTDAELDWRDRFARALELVILLDRALLLEEMGFQVELLQVFEPRLSPRNIALIASRAD